jgi:hypothetical protein
MDFPTKAKHNTIKQFDAMKPTTESVNESTPDQVIKDLDKAKNDLLKKVDALIAKKKKLYSDVDIEAPMSADEKKLDKDIADLFSQINKLVLQKRSVKKESVNEGSLYSSQQLIKKLTPKIEKDVEVLKKQFPKYDISLVRNRYESDGSYTLSISGKNTSDTDNKTIQKVVASKIKESVNEASMSDIDIIAQESPNFKEFVKSFFADYTDFPKTKDSLKWLEDIYKGRTKMEGLGADGLERVAQGLPQTEEEPEN